MAYDSLERAAPAATDCVRKYTTRGGVTMGKPCTAPLVLLPLAEFESIESFLQRDARAGAATASRGQEGGVESEEDGD